MSVSTAPPQQQQPQRPTGETSQLRCSGCACTLQFPVGAPAVRCPMCNAVTTTAPAVQSVHIRCVRCHVCLALPSNALLARCPRCQQVMQMPRLQNQAGGPPAGMSSASFAAQQQCAQNNMGPPRQVVYIENPPMRDDKGKIHSCTNVATKLDDVW